MKEGSDTCLFKFYIPVYGVYVIVFCLNIMEDVVFLISIFLLSSRTVKLIGKIYIYKNCNVLLLSVWVECSPF